MAMRPASKEQIKAIRATAHGRLRWTDEQYHEWLEYFGWKGSTVDLSRAQAANVLDTLIDLAAGRRVRVWHVNQATVRQRQEIDRMAVEAGFRGIDDQDLGGVVHQTTHGRVASVASCSIYEARAVFEALRSIVNRKARQAARMAQEASA